MIRDPERAKRLESEIVELAEGLDEMREDMLELLVHGYSALARRVISLEARIERLEGGTNGGVARR